MYIMEFIMIISFGINLIDTNVMGVTDEQFPNYIAFQNDIDFPFDQENSSDSFKDIFRYHVYLPLVN